MSSDEPVRIFGDSIWLGGRWVKLVPRQELSMSEAVAASTTSTTGDVSSPASSPGRPAGSEGETA